MSKEKFQTVRGMYDVLPEQQPAFRLITDTFKRLADQAGYKFIDTPIVEDAALYVRGVGTGTDIVDKEIYSFEDRSGNMVALRPEGSAGVVRAYLQHGMGSLPQPVKLAYVAPMFRYDRPQAGRQRQHTQVGVELLGEKAPSADAQVITLANRLFKTLGLTDFSLQINSIGDLAGRTKYRKILVEYLEAHQDGLDELDRERLKTNPLRVLDSKSPKTAKVLADAPQILNHLSKEAEAHFRGVLEYLDDLGVEYELNPLLVRGLDYYTDTVFEFVGTRAGQQASLGGGGRYNGLVELLGGKPTPAVGFGLGVERIMLELENSEITPQPASPVKVFVASLGEPARLAAFALIEKLLDAGVGAAGAVDKNGIASQLGRADKLGVDYAIIIGQKEVMDKTIILRDMKSGAQEMVALDKIVADLAKRF